MICVVQGRKTFVMYSPAEQHLLQPTVVGGSYLTIAREGQG